VSHERRQQANLETLAGFYQAIFTGTGTSSGANITDDFAVVEAPGAALRRHLEGVPGFQKLFAAMGAEHFKDPRHPAQDDHRERRIRRWRTSRSPNAPGRQVPPGEVEVAELTSFRDGKIACLKPFYFDTKPSPRRSRRDRA